MLKNGAHCHLELILLGPSNKHIISITTYDFITNCRRYGEIGSRDLRYHQLRLTLKTVAKSHYDYHYFLFINNNNDGNPFAEPTEVYTNINGGYGVFTTYLERVVIINL